MKEEAFLAAIVEDPAEPTAWLALADWLEERGDPRGQLLRLTRILLQPGGDRRPVQEERLRCLLAEGVRPCWPTVTNSIGMQFALIPAGTFLMGSPEDEEGREEDEGPQHEVTLSRPFWLRVHPVTQAQYEQVMGTNPSWFSSQGPGNAKVEKQDTRSFPVEQVSWEDAAAFCRTLSERAAEQEHRRVYRLPTEAEWEYACRGGISSTPFSFGHSPSLTQANFDGTDPGGGAAAGPSPRRPTPVGSYPPNAFGLFDMHGNVWEWCADRDEPYPYGAITDPTGRSKGSCRVIRGGAWSHSGWNCRAAARSRCEPARRDCDLGFRVACGFPSSVP
jgi:uncharacterized protein (TIGR02996 family)